MASRTGDTLPGPSIGKNRRIVRKKLARKLLNSFGCEIRRGPEELEEPEPEFELLLIYLLGIF